MSDAAYFHDFFVFADLYVTVFVGDDENVVVFVGRRHITNYTVYTIYKYIVCCFLIQK